MRSSLSMSGVLTAATAVALGGCSPTGTTESAQSPPMSTTVVSGTSAPSAPPAPEPAATESCPYLPTAWVARTNGQRVSKVRVSDDEPPACFFYTLDGNQQLMSRVYTGDPEVATAIVDSAAPIDESNPAKAPARSEEHTSE